VSRESEGSGPSNAQTGLSKAPAVGAAHRRHVAAVYATVRNLQRQMEDAALAGRSPTGVGPPLTPLPPQEAEAILAPVRELKAHLRAFAAETAPSELARLESAQGVNNTLVWLTNLLDKVRDSVDGLQPGRARKYGILSPEHSGRLQTLHDDLSSMIAKARSALEPRRMGP
jgi:hypothetical protein